MKIKVGSKVRLKSLEAILSEPNVYRNDLPNNTFSIRTDDELIFDTTECAEKIFGSVVTINRIDHGYTNTRYTYADGMYFNKYVTIEAIEEVIE